MDGGGENLVSCWLRADQTNIVRAITEQAGLEIVGAGSPDGPSVAQSLGAESFPDLRSLLSSAPTGIVLIADQSGTGTDSDTSVLESVLDAAERGVHVLTLEPIPAAALHLSSPAWRDAADTVRERISFVPLARRSSAYAGMSELLSQFGEIEAVGIRVLCTRAAGSLGARLFGICELLVTLLGTPETIDAAHVSDTATPDTLRGLSGHMTANIRFPGGRCASIMASDTSSGWSRSITLIGPKGVIDASDNRIRWMSPEGQILDEAQMSDTRDPVTLESTLIADSIVASLTPAFRSSPIDMNATLAMAQAALLSARTGHPESPSMILDILSRA